jgi:hypothetical protein
MLSTKMNSSLIIGMATMLMLTLVAAITTTTTAAFAQKLPESGFGQAAKDLASTETGAVGQHSQAGSSDVGDQPNFDNSVDPSGVPGREGIGNVAGEPEGSVGQLGCDLGGLDC